MVDLDPDGIEDLEEREGERRSVGEGLPQILHDRARKSGEELHKLLLTFSTAILAVYFLALTTEIEPELTNTQSIISILGVLFMGVAVASGMFSLLADTKRNYFRACAIQAGKQDERDKFFRFRDKWLSWHRRTSTILRCTFIIGIALSVLYMIARILNV